MNNKLFIIKYGCSVEFIGSDGKKVVWGVVENYVVEKLKYIDEIVLQGFISNFFTRSMGGGGGSI